MNKSCQEIRVHIQPRGLFVLLNHLSETTRAATSRVIQVLPVTGVW